MALAPHHRLYACFFLFSSVSGAMFSRLPDIELHLGVNKSQLGLVLIGAAIGSLISLTLAAPVIERLGPRTTAYITLIGSTFFYASVSFITFAPLAFLALLGAGLMVGALEINLNVELSLVERATGRSIMSRAHGFWSLGFFATAMVAAGLRQFEISAQAHLAGIFILVLIATLAIVSGIGKDRPNLAMPSEKTPMFAFPSVALLPLCVIGLTAFLIEGAGVDWSSIYMRDVFAPEPFVGGLALTFFTLTMAIARLFAGGFVDKFSPRAVVTVLLGVSAVGLVGVWLAPNPLVAIIGFALLGGGCSAIYPLVISAAARRTDRPSAINVAAVGQVSFVIFFLAPPILGFVAQYFGIRNSYIICLPVIVGALLMVSSLPARPKRSSPETMPDPLSLHG